MTTLVSSLERAPLNRGNLRHVWRHVCAALMMMLCFGAAQVWGTELAFDLPEVVECRDVTPAEFASAHPTRKVIEGKFRISARVVEGQLADVVDMLYVLDSTHKSLRLQDYLPNTTLESAVVDDQIEVTDASEKAHATGIEAHVAYKPVVIGGSHNQSSKKTESNHFKQIAAKDLVLAAGTTNREHGVFFRLRPSRSASLEGAKEFTFLATVPKSWRGDLCTISCVARANKKTLISTSIVEAGAVKAQIGMYLAGDAEAANTAEELRKVQDAYVAVLAAQPPKDNNPFTSFSNQAASVFTGKKPGSQARQKLSVARSEMSDVQNRLKELAQ